MSLPEVSFTSFGFEKQIHHQPLNYGALPQRKKVFRKNQQSQDLREVMSRESREATRSKLGVKDKTAPPRGSSQVFLNNRPSLSNPLESLGQETKDSGREFGLNHRPLIILEPLTTMKSPNPGMRIPVRKSG